MLSDHGKVLQSAFHVGDLPLSFHTGINQIAADFVCHIPPTADGRLKCHAGARDIRRPLALILPKTYPTGIHIVFFLSTCTARNIPCGVSSAGSCGMRRVRRDGITKSVIDHRSPVQLRNSLAGDVHRRVAK